MTETNLGTFEGKDVIQVGVKFVGGATGLNAAMAVKPETHHQGEEVYLIVRGKVKVGFEDITDTDCLKRVENVKIEDAAYVTAELASETLDAQAQMVEEAKGIHQLPNMAMIEAHERGEHADSYEFGCPTCDKLELAERDALAAEAAEATGKTKAAKTDDVPRTPSGRKSRAKAARAK